MLLDTWSNVLTSSFQNLWWGFVAFVPNLLVAIIIFILGWLVGGVLGRVVGELIKALKVDHALETVGAGGFFHRSGFRLNTGAFVGGLVKWFVIVVFLLASAEVLGLHQITSFLQGIVLGFLPNVIVATLILLMAALIAEAVQRIVVGAAKAAGLHSSHFAGVVARWAIWLFAIIAALLQLGVAVVLLQTLFTGLVAMLALAGGLAFGLGGRESAARYLERVQREMGSHQG
jgi:hypothetical protein